MTPGDKAAPGVVAMGALYGHPAPTVEGSTCAAAVVVTPATLAAIEARAAERARLRRHSISSAAYSIDLARKEIVESDRTVTKYEGAPDPADVDLAIVAAALRQAWADRDAALASVARSADAAVEAARELGHIAASAVARAEAAEAMARGDAADAELDRMMMARGAGHTRPMVSAALLAEAVARAEAAERQRDALAGAVRHERAVVAARIDGTASGAAVVRAPERHGRCSCVVPVTPALAVLYALAWFVVVGAAQFALHRRERDTFARCADLCRREAMRAARDDDDGAERCYRAIEAMAKGETEE